MTKSTLPKTQKQRLVAILSDGNFHTLFEIQEECRRRFNAFDSETALSARWRELPLDCREMRKREGTKQTYEYRLIGAAA